MAPRIILVAGLLSSVVGAQACLPASRCETDAHCNANEECAAGRCRVRTDATSSSSGGGADAGSPDAGPVDRNWADWPLAPDRPTDFTTTPETVTDNLTGLTWQRTVIAEPLAWSNAVAYCNDLVYADADDWRLPTMIELVSIVSFDVYEPAINTTAFPATPLDYFWSATHYTNSQLKAWTLHFKFGFTYNDDVAVPHQVRCVRGPGG
ncbi:MAG: DUF1566 domain-containing protein [Myxococcota bacterium]